MDSAARRQKWIDNSHNVNLFLASPEMKVLSHIYRRAADVGLKNTYYLSSRQATNIDKATAYERKEQHGLITGKATIMHEYTAEGTIVCLIDSMWNDGECDECQ